MRNSLTAPALKSVASAILLLLLTPALRAQTPPPAPTPPATFDTQANTALETMRRRADELHINGVALVAYADGDTVQSWTSKMLVVGHMTTPVTPTDKGSNLLGVAYTKAAEMADTLKDSGSKVRPPMTGEYGYQGGLIAHTTHGYIIVAFSGGKSEDDLQVSHAGLNVLKPAL